MLMSAQVGAVVKCGREAGRQAGRQGGRQGGREAGRQGGRGGNGFRMPSRWQLGCQLGCQLGHLGTCSNSPPPSRPAQPAQGSVLRCDVQGRLVMKAFLSGMPDIKLGLNDKLEVGSIGLPHVARGWVLGCALCPTSSWAQENGKLEAGAAPSWSSGPRACPGPPPPRLPNSPSNGPPLTPRPPLPPRAGRHLPPLREPGALQRGKGGRPVAARRRLRLRRAAGGGRRPGWAAAAAARFVRRLSRRPARPPPCRPAALSRSCRAGGVLCAARRRVRADEVPLHGRVAAAWGGVGRRACVGAGGGGAGARGQPRVAAIPCPASGPLDPAPQRAARRPSHPRLCALVPCTPSHAVHPRPRPSRARRRHHAALQGGGAHQRARAHAAGRDRQGTRLCSPRPFCACLLRLPG